jgi:hypothetical protein
MPIYTDGELRNYIRALLPDYRESQLELLTITAIEDSKGEAVTLQFHYGVNGYEW